jgi:integrase
VECPDCTRRNSRKARPCKQGCLAPACRKAGIEGFTWHALRRTAMHNWRLQGHAYFRIMAATGHKTMTVFKRYNIVSKEEGKALVGEKI